MTVTHKKPAQGLTVEEAQQVVDQCLADTNVNIPITAVVRATQ